RLWAGDTLLGNAALSANQARESLGYGRWNTLTLNVDGQVHQQASGKNLKVEVLNTGDENRDIVFVDNIRLAKLTGAMATFGDDPGSIDSRTSEGRYTIQPVLAPTVS
ncbi:VCBS domain-containing protein, partial [Vibrio coralliilyticus]|uniref:VCBS domain-containing protein n=3 Tax=Vibrio coralliilyticus TaxID=190893 RepID=UPI00148D2F16